MTIIRGNLDLIYDPKGQGDFYGRFDLVYYLQGNGDLRGHFT